MKKIIFTVIICFLQTAAVFPQSLIVKGHYTGKKADTIVLKVMTLLDHVDYDPKREIVAKTFPDAHGNFRLTGTVPKDGTFCTVEMGQNSFLWRSFFYPGDSVFIEADDSNVNYYGKGSTTQKYFDSCSVLKLHIGYKKYLLEKEAYLRLVDSIETAERVFTDKYADKENWRPVLRQTMHWETLYEYKLARLMYIWAHNAAANKEGLVKLEPEYFSFIKPGDLSNEKALNTISYINFLNEMPSAIWKTRWAHLPEAEQARLKDGSQFTRIAQGAKIIDSLYKGIILESVYGSYIVSLMRYNNSLALKDYTYQRIDSILEIMHGLENQYHAGLYESLKAKRISMTTVVEAPAFSLPDTTGKILNLRAYRGKVVLLDFWEPGCLPCIQAIPDDNKLVETYAGKNFVYLAIACACPPKILRKVTDKYQWHGMQLIDNGKVMGDYNVTGFPTYILIDKKGMIRNPHTWPGIDLNKEIDRLLAE